MPFDCGLVFTALDHEIAPLIQIPPPWKRFAFQSFAWAMALPAGTLVVSHTLPAIVEPWPTVIGPRPA